MKTSGPDSVPVTSKASTPDDSEPSDAHQRAATLARLARDFVHESRTDRSDPLVHASSAVVEAADTIALAATADQADPTDRVALLHEALASVRAAVVAIRYAVVEEGDRNRQRRSADRIKVRRHQTLNIF